LRIYILTEEEPFYLPVSIDHILAERGSDIVEVATVPTTYRGESSLRFVWRQFRFMGLRGFVLYGVDYARSKVLDCLDRIKVLSPKRPYSVAMACQRHNVLCREVADVNDASFLERLRTLRVDVVVSLSCPQLFGKALIDLPPAGCLNVHSALLPRYRGWLPTFWVLANGETETGVTVQYMGCKIDEGDIILQRMVSITEDDTLDSLIRRCKMVGADSLLKALDLIEQGRVEPQPINIEEGSYYSFPTPEAVARFRARGRRFR